MSRLLYDEVCKDAAEGSELVSAREIITFLLTVIFVSAQTRQKNPNFTEFASYRDVKL